ncbi:MAG TPA: TIGR03668 family PPOX class F420-dependent oxidoreductase [Methylomirabilota bacterium]|nr:TIGR03668 family PPOX class F420-dependent oxidoreductase [Methylomirabilota bacterium]
MSSIPASVAGFISAGRVGHLGTADASGQPLVVPICYAFDGTALFSAVDAKPKSRAPERLQRIRNIRENAQVSVVINHYEEDWTRLRHVLIQGDAEVLTGGPEFSRAADLLLAKYPQYRELGLSRDGGVMIKVVPARVQEWRFSN